jgi:hypothetical protein
MTPREKVLGFGVGGILLLAACQYTWMKYRDAVAARQARIEALDNQILQARDRLIQGAYADRMMGEYLVRSLPSNLETARADYSRWLYEIITLVDLQDAAVKYVNTIPVRDPNADPAGNLYLRHGFKVSGKTDQRGWIELLHLFHSKDYLHRLTDWSVRPAREGGLAIEMTIDVVGLTAASPDLKSPDYTSPLVDDFDAYAQKIWNRNFFSPPNQPPRFSGETQLTANRGEASLKLTAEDPEKNRLTYAIVGEAPAGLEIDPASGNIRWSPQELGDYRVTVRVSDDGYPSQSTEQSFAIAVVDPPPPPEPEAGPPKFDDSTQTVLTALVQGGGDWTAWMKVRTQGTTLKLKPGDPFEIGRLSGTVVDVNARFVTLEIDGKRFELRPAGNLSEAARAVSNNQGQP